MAGGGGACTASLIGTGLARVPFPATHSFEVYPVPAASTNYALVNEALSTFNGKVRHKARNRTPLSVCSPAAPLIPHALTNNNNDDDDDNNNNNNNPAYLTPPRPVPRAHSCPCSSAVGAPTR